MRPLQTRCHSRFPGQLLALSIAMTVWTVPGSQSVHQTAYAQAGLAPLEDSDYWLRLCQLQTTIANYEDALTACEQAIVLKPEDATLWTVHSEILLNLEQYPEAIVSAERAIALDNDNVLALTYQCQSYSALGQTEAALDFCNQATTAEIDDISTVGDIEETDDELATADTITIKAPSPTVLALREQGNALEAAGEFEAALSVYEQLQFINPADSISLAYKCRTQVALQQYDKAVATCQQALESDRQWTAEHEAFTFYYQGLAHARLGEHLQAVASFDKALAINSEDAEVWIAQGFSLQAQGQSVPALVSYTRAVELAPMSSRSLLGQCIAQNHILEYESAAAACQQAIQGDGQWFREGEAEAWNQWGRALSGQNMHEEALAALSRAIGMRPNYTEAWSNQSVVHWFLGNIAQEKRDIRGAIAQYTMAIDTVEKALEIIAVYPANTNTFSDTSPSGASSSDAAFSDTVEKSNLVEAYAYANLGRYQRSLAQLYSEENSPQSAAVNFTGALIAYNQALGLNPEDAETWVNKSVVLWFLGDYQNAQASASRAISINPNLVPAWQSQAVALVALGDYPAARTSYREALLRDSENADAWAGFGIVNLQLEEQEIGLAALQRALAINPAQPTALEAIALLSEE